MATSTLDICPKCKGHLLLEKDNYGLYQQCLQCGYLHDLQTFPSIAIEETEDEKVSMVSYHVPTKGSPATFQDTAGPIEGYHRMAQADPMDFRIILDTLRKRHQENRE